MDDEYQMLIAGIIVGIIVGIGLGMAIESSNVEKLCQEYKINNSLCEQYMNKLGYK